MISLVCGSKGRQKIQTDVKISSFLPKKRHNSMQNSDPAWLMLSGNLRVI